MVGSALAWFEGTGPALAQDEPSADSQAPAPVAARKLQSAGININNTGWGRPTRPMPPEALDALARSGAAWVRVTLPWSVIQRNENGPEDWTSIDRFVMALRSKNLNILMDVKSPPCWARADRSLPCQSPARRGYIPRRDLWKQFLSEAVRHYKGQVTYWEIWNEPNYSHNFYLSDVRNNADIRFSEYARRVLVPAAQAVHAADPDAKVAAPVVGASAGSTSPEEFADRLRLALGGGAARLVDVVTMHVYPPGDPIAYGEAARRAMAELGIADRPLWVTETGMRYSGFGASMGLSGPPQYLSDLFERNFSSRKPVFDKIFWFALLDGKRNRYGLLNDDWSPRPAYSALRDLSADSSIP
jgi:hypothetical protein